MASVAVNKPKTPVTKGSNGMATATVPNVCKMPGPPAPFVPTPLPNIGQSGKAPDGYSTTVKIEGEPVAIQGASFGSSGDIASKGTGGGIISSNAEGPTKFLGPGSLDVKIEGKNVQLLSDPMLNNCGPSGSPPNAATMVGLIQQAAMLGITPEIEAICLALCECLAGGQGQNCVSAALKGQDAAMGGKSPIKAETPYNTSTTPPSPTSYPGDRRPDAVIVNNPSLPPIQSNLKAVVEIKIPPDDWGKGQQEDYERIAGDPDKVVLVTPEECGCPDKKKRKVDPVPVKKPEEEEERQLSFPGWLKPVAVVLAVTATVAAVVALAPVEVVVGAGALAGAGAFALFSGPSGGGADGI